MAANPTLSVVLPVYNAQQTLAGNVAKLLDVLPDLTSEFEILIIDDGSTDQTDEVAFELAKEYPQVAVVKHGTRRGHSGAVETGLARTSGEIMFVQDDQATIDSSKLHRLWDLRHEEDVVFARPEFRVKKSLLQRLAAWGVRLEEATQGGQIAGVQMIRRNSLGQMNELDAIEPGVIPSRRPRIDRPEGTRERQPMPKFSANDRPRPMTRFTP